MSKNITCTECAGTGKVEVGGHECESYYIQCSKCNGTGGVPERIKIQEPKFEEMSDKEETAYNAGMVYYYQMLSDCLEDYGIPRCPGPDPEFVDPVIMSDWIAKKIEEAKLAN